MAKRIRKDPYQPYPGETILKQLKRLQTMFANYAETLNFRCINAAEFIMLNIVQGFPKMTPDPQK